MSATEIQKTDTKKTNGSTAPAAATAKPATEPKKKGKPSKEEREKLLAAMTPEERIKAEEAIALKSRKVYIITGPVLEFKNAAEAEKFLNGDPTAPTDFTVIKGQKVVKKQKTSLR